jgi:hypothetical protein
MNDAAPTWSFLPFFKASRRTFRFAKNLGVPPGNSQLLEPLNTIRELTADERVSRFRPDVDLYCTNAGADIARELGDKLQDITLRALAMSLSYTTEESGHETWLKFMRTGDDLVQLQPSSVDEHAGTSAFPRSRNRFSA